MQKTKKWKSWAAGYVMILPYLALFLMFSLYPIIQAVRISFYKWPLLGDKIFIGVTNYTRLFGDERFWNSLLNTFYFVIVTTPLFTIVALLLAVIVNGLNRATSFFRSVFYFPAVLSVSVIASLWVYILRPYTGALSGVLDSLGLPDIFWLTEPGLARIAIVIISLWWTVGFSFILYLAGLQEIPKTYYEAAALDGASAWQTFRYVTFPALSRVTLLVAVLQMIASFRIFGQVILTTNGGPADATRTTVMYMYRSSFERQDFGYGATVSVILLAVIMIFTLGQFYFMRSEKA